MWKILGGYKCGECALRLELEKLEARSDLSSIAPFSTRKDSHQQQQVAPGFVDALMREAGEPQCVVIS